METYSTSAPPTPTDVLWSVSAWIAFRMRRSQSEHEKGSTRKKTGERLVVCLTKEGGNSWEEIYLGQNINNIRGMLKGLDDEDEDDDNDDDDDNDR